MPRALGPRRISYTCRQWRNARAGHLRTEPLCRYCKDAGLVTVATVVDHIIPHKGDLLLFWDSNNWQSLCSPCHDRTKQQQEARGYSTAIGGDGWPLDPRHPRHMQKNLR